MRQTFCISLTVRQKPKQHLQIILRAHREKYIVQTHRNINKVPDKGLVSALGQRSWTTAAGSGPRRGHCSPCCKLGPWGRGTGAGAEARAVSRYRIHGACGCSTCPRNAGKNSSSPAKDKPPRITPQRCPERALIKSNKKAGGKKSQCSGLLQANGDSGTGRDLAVKMKVGTYIYIYFFFNVYAHRSIR